MLLSEIASCLKAELRTPSTAEVVVTEVDITGVASPALAGPTHLVFAENETALSTACASRAAAILTCRNLAAKVSHKPVLVADHPKLAFAQAARLLRAQAAPAGIHRTAVVHPAATLGDRVSIGPGVVIDADVSIGADAILDAGVVVGAGVRIGARCHLYPRVVLYPGTELGDRVIVHAGAVLGADGFGYVRDYATGEYTQFPQQGRLFVGDDVEIGANTTIDRGALEATRIGCGSKLDNLVHVGHNVQIGSNVVIAAQTGVSGSSVIGDGAVIGGQAGLGDHAEVGPGVILGGQAGILPGKRVEGAGAVLWGTPAKPVKEHLRELAALGRLARRAPPSPSKDTQ